jgi:hypothetical protein
MIHYRLLNSDSTPATDTVYRSLKRARKARKEGVNVWAFNSRKSALDLAPQRLKISQSEDAPVIITDGQVDRFIEAHNDARQIHPKYPPSSASSRRQLEQRFSYRLFGFINGDAIDAQQFMDVSCRWVRYSCPIYVNGSKKTIRALSI